MKEDRRTGQGLICKILDRVVSRKKPGRDILGGFRKHEPKYLTYEFCDCYGCEIRTSLKRVSYVALDMQKYINKIKKHLGIEEEKE